MGRYSKLIGAVVGNLVAIVLAYLAVKSPGLAQCVPAPGTIDSDAFNQFCSVLGFSQAQITAFLMGLVNSGFVYAFPANTSGTASGGREVRVTNIVNDPDPHDPLRDRPRPPRSPLG